MMKQIAAAALLAMSASAAADCLEISEAEFEQQKTDFGLTEVVWQARIANSCAKAYDAEMTIRFLDAEGKDVYTVQERLSVALQGSDDIHKRASVPRDAASRMRDLEIDVIERERPF